MPTYVAADLSSLPFADESFDGVTCGYVLEHLPEPQIGLAELARVMKPGADVSADDRRQFLRRMDQPLLVLPDLQPQGADASSANRSILRWKRELWFTNLHRVIRAGGICVEIEKA